MNCCYCTIVRLELMLLSRAVGLLQLSYLLTCGMYVQVSVVLQGFRKCPTKVLIQCQTINDQNNLNTATFISPTKVWFIVRQSMIRTIKILQHSYRLFILLYELMTYFLKLLPYDVCQFNGSCSVKYGVMSSNLIKVTFMMHVELHFSGFEQFRIGHTFELKPYLLLRTATFQYFFSLSQMKLLLCVH